MRGDGYVTAAEVAEATGQQLSTVHRAIEAERIPGGKVGAAWYVAIHDYAETFSTSGPQAGMRGRLDELAKLVGKRASGTIAKSAAPEKPRTTRKAAPKKRAAAGASARR